LYWNFIDWYAESYSEFTNIKHTVDYQYQIDNSIVNIGDVVKINFVGNNTWLLLEKINDIESADNTVNYKTVGRQNGTIEFSDRLYNTATSGIGYDIVDSFDAGVYDKEVSNELRNIFRAVKNDIFKNEYAVEWNKLFFISVRYVLEEQTYVDWAFKTSFLNAAYKVGELEQKLNYRNDSLDSYLEYINEVKPFHTKLREYRVGYRQTEVQDGLFTDFDNPPFYDEGIAKIRNIDPDGVIDETRITEYPYKIWNTNYKKSVKTLTISNAGSGYTTAPTVTFLGGSIGSTGPFQILGTSNAGSTSGSYGYYYPLFTDQTKANIYDKQNGGTGASHTHTFDEYSGKTFYMPTN